MITLEQVRGLYFIAKETEIPLHRITIELSPSEWWALGAALGAHVDFSMENKGLLFGMNIKRQEGRG